MNNKYKCLNCNYSTAVCSNYHKHLRTKKHISKETLIDILLAAKNNTTLLKPSKKASQYNPVKCTYCNKQIYAYKFMKRHYKSCKEYAKHITEKENNVKIQELINENNKLLKERDTTILKLLNEINKLTIDHNTFISKNKKKHYKYKRKEPIPATVRNTIWNLYTNDTKNAKCYCCGIEPITKGNFECGHIISEKAGGKIHLDNLRPICSLCNKSMGTMNMKVFMEKYGYDTLKKT